MVFQIEIEEEKAEKTNEEKKKKREEPTKENEPTEVDLETIEKDRYQHMKTGFEFYFPEEWNETVYVKEKTSKNAGKDENMVDLGFYYIDQRRGTDVLIMAMYMYKKEEVKKEQKEAANVIKVLEYGDYVYILTQRQNITDIYDTTSKAYQNILTIIEQCKIAFDSAQVEK